MKKNVFIFIMLSLISCDVPGVLRVKNSSGGKAFFILHQKKSIEKTEQINLEIDHGTEKGVLFGFGQHWTDEHIKEYLSEIDSIEIITSFDTLLISNKNKMYQYFKKRRRGLFKQTMKIKIE